MTKKTKIIITLLILFILMTFVSLLFLSYTHANPIEKTLVTSLYTYGFRGTYNYIAALKPNTIYDNKTTLEPGEGPIYRRITDHIDVNFTYVWEGDLPANFTIKYSIHEYVQTANWNKQIIKLPQKTIETTGTSSHLSINNIPTIDPSSIQQLGSEINAETGISASTYSLNITIITYVEARTSVGTVNESFTPTLRIEFQSSASEGDTLSISGLEHDKTGEITKTEKTYQSWVEQQRNYSYGLSTVSFFGLAITTWVFLKTRPPKPPRPQKLLEDLIGPYEEIIVEAAQEPSRKGQLPLTTIAINELEDLVKIADMSDKPILHTYKPPETHIFRIIDGPTRYEFTTTISTIAKRKAAIEEDENE
jgi:hypothetical protein